MRSKKIFVLAIVPKARAIFSGGRKMERKSLIICIFVLAAMLSQMASVANASVIFSDYFDGTAVDESKWMVSIAPPRFRQSTGPFDPEGSWVTPSGNPPYGTVSVSNLWISLWNGYSTVFPYVVSQINPFPETGDFILKFK